MYILHYNLSGALSREKNIYPQSTFFAYIQFFFWDSLFSSRKVTILTKYRTKYATL